MKNELQGMVLPACEILVNNQKRKLYGKKQNKVYLHNGDNFQLKLFNPLQERIGIQLNMNGTKVDNDLLILNPGQETTIERFIGTNRKLTFSAYDIDTTNMSESKIKDAQKAIEKNGVLEIIFWNEKKIQPFVYTTTTTTIPYYLDPNWITYNGALTNSTPLYGYSGSTGTMGMAGMSGTSGHPVGTNSTVNINVNLNESKLTKRVKSSSETDQSIEYFSDTFDYAPQEKYRGIVDKIEPKKIETGRIEKGNVSNQYFKPISFETGEPFYQIKFKLLPFSLKPLKKKSMTQA